MQHEIISSLVPGDLVFDVGANLGEKSEWFNQKGLQLVCVEPQPEMARLLRVRFNGNPNVTVVEKGLADVPGSLEISICSKAPTLSTFAEHWKHGRFSEVDFDAKATVEMTTLDLLVAKHGVPRYCKIDVEGFERNVILGLTRRIGIVSYEFTSDFMDDAFAVMQHLIKLGYTRFNISIAEGDRFEFPTWKPYFELVSLMHASRASSGLWGDVYAN